MRQLQPKIGVTHLKIQALDRIKMRNLYAYEFWSTCSCSTFGSRASRNALSPSQQIQCGVEGQALWSSTAVDLHGICSIDLAQWTSGYRSVFKFEARSTLSSGFQEPVAKSTLADANEKRAWRLWEDLAKSLINRARNLYQGESLGLDLDNTVYALDSSTIDLTMSVFPWAKFRSIKSGIKLHTQLDLRGPIPVCIYISEAKVNDIKWLDELIFEPGAIYIMDRGYIDWARLFQIASSGAFFVIRAKDNLRFTRYKSQPVDKSTGLRSDQIGKLSILKSKGDFPTHLRRVRFYDEEKKKHLVFLTNNLQIPALTVAKLYKKRWEIELFFKWIKGNLEIKHYYGTSANAVKTQIWIAVSLYLIVAIIHKNLKLPGSLRNTLQILSVHPFDKTPLNELLMNISSQNDPERNFNQLEMFNL